MKRFSFFSLLLILVLSVGAQELPQDPAVRIGKLKNGLTYYIRHNEKELGLADFYIAQCVGSIQEEPRQRGLAHFLEHVSFNMRRFYLLLPQRSLVRSLGQEMVSNCQCIPHLS